MKERKFLTTKQRGQLLGLEFDATFTLSEVFVHKHDWQNGVEE